MEQTKLTQEDADRIIDEALKKSEEMLKTNPFIAQIILKQLLKGVPNHPQGLQLLGLCSHRLGNHIEGIEIISMAIELDPTDAENHNNIALCYASLGDFERSIDHLKKALEIKPNNYLFLSNLALQLRQVGEHYKSVECFEKALNQKETAEIYTNLGGVYGELKQIDKSIECFEKAIRIDPEMAASHVDLAYAHHLKGDWDKGFKEYEWRFEFFPQLHHYKELYNQEKKWTGKESLEGKTIFLYGEQGLGDLIMFSRYIPELKKRGATVILHCSPVIQSIFNRTDYVDQTFVCDVIEEKDKEFPEYDYQCSTMSLPHLLGTYKVSNDPYLKSIDVEGKNVLSKYKNTFNIGIVWAGSPAHPTDASRSMPLKYFKSLYEMDGVKLFSLQLDTRNRVYRHGKEKVNLVENAEEMTGIVDLSTMIQNFDDSAYFLSNLDLVITVDTAVLHLAGALGVPAWGLISYHPDFRWKMEGDETHWYPSVKLFRQKQSNNWQELMERVTDELKDLLSNQ